MRARVVGDALTGLLLVKIALTGLLPATAFAESPPNSHTMGNQWYCDAGYFRSADRCVPLKVPENAHVLGNNWYCDAGYSRSAHRCVPLKVPENAHVLGNNWYCDTGYFRSGDRCLPLKVPENAHVLGNNWYCNQGFQRSGAHCIPLAPAPTGGSFGSEQRYRTLPKGYSRYGGGSRSYEYDVTGYGDGGYVYGNIDADGNRDVSGYLYKEDGEEVYFDGEWTGKGEIEGYDEDGNYYELEVE